MGRDILIVGPSRYFLSGISYYTMGLANALAKDNNVSVVCLRKLLPRFLFPGKNRVGNQISDIDFSDEVDVFDGVDYYNPKSWKDASAFIRRKHPQAMIVQWWTSSVAHMLLALSRTAKEEGCKIILEMHEVVDPIEHGNPLLRVYSKMFGKMLFPLADTFVTHSESDKKAISSIYELDGRGIHVIPLVLNDQCRNRVDQPDAKKKLGLENEFVVMTFGLIRTYKGIPYLIEAFNQLPGDVAENSRLLVVGEIWDDRPGILETVGSSPYSDRITLVDDYVPDSDVPTYFSACDLVCLPYLRASQSGVAHMAANFGKPVVVSSVGGLVESMSSYEGTRFVPPKNVAAITKEISGLYGAWKSGTVVEFEPPQISWDTTVDKFGEVFSKSGLLGTTV